MKEFVRQLEGGSSYSCCGPVAYPSTVRAINSIASALDLTQRHMGDAHFENASTGVYLPDGGEDNWSGVAVIFLDDMEGVEVKGFSKWAPVPKLLSVRRGDVIQVPVGGQTLHSKVVRIAWVPFKAKSEPRSYADFYLASTLRKHFVNPHETAAERRFFREHTSSARSSILWHNFVWSFIGTFCTCAGIIPLAWLGLKRMEERYRAELPIPATMRAHGGRLFKGQMSLEMEKEILQQIWSTEGGRNFMKQLGYSPRP